MKRSRIRRFKGSSVTKFMVITFFLLFSGTFGLSFAQESTGIKDESIQQLLEEFHLDGMKNIVDRLGVRKLTQDEFEMSREFWEEKLRIQFTKTMPLDRKEEKLTVEYKLLPHLSIRGEVARKGNSEQGALDIIYGTEY